MLVFLGLLTVCFCAAPYMEMYEELACTTLTMVMDNTYLTDGGCYESTPGMTGYGSAITQCTGDVLDYMVTFASTDCTGANTTYPMPFDTCTFGMISTCATPTIPGTFMTATTYNGGVDCTAVRVEYGGAPTIMHTAPDPNFGMGCLDNRTSECDVTLTTWTMTDYDDYMCTVVADSVALTTGCNSAQEHIDMFGGPIQIADIADVCGTVPADPCGVAEACTATDSDFCCDADTTAFCDSSDEVTSPTACDHGCNGLTNVCWGDCALDRDCTGDENSWICCGDDTRAHCDDTGVLDEIDTCTLTCAAGICALDITGSFWDLYSSYVYYAIAGVGGLIGVIVVLSLLSTVIGCVCKAAKKGAKHAF